MFQSAESLLWQKNRSGVPYAAHVKTVKLSARHEVCKRYSAALGSAQLGMLRLDSLHLAARCLLGANFAQRLCIESRALEARCRPGRVSSALMREQFGSVRFGSCSLARYVWSSPVPIAVPVEVAVAVSVVVAKRLLAVHSLPPERPDLVSSRAVPGFSSCSSECDEKLVSVVVVVVVMA